jgi:hypothetical protein
MPQTTELAMLGLRKMAAQGPLFLGPKPLRGGRRGIAFLARIRLRLADFLVRALLSFCHCPVPLN